MFLLYLLHPCALVSWERGLITLLVAGGELSTSLSPWWASEPWSLLSLCGMLWSKGGNFPLDWAKPGLTPSPVSAVDDSCTCGFKLLLKFQWVELRGLCSLTKQNKGNFTKLKKTLYWQFEICFLFLAWLCSILLWCGGQGTHVTWVLLWLLRQETIIEPKAGILFAV